ncbi:MAG: tRNA lysidine(34) synthetase TilS [Gammaproteobacteria bacterium]|nr:tRNA lysidine(34) synthetase TilS [Gammaproteobacteria bacterium]|tara:strand:- start:2851 stop:4200 length:1350 start_codon:yes stop_codon:yes gene_type:complete
MFVAANENIEEILKQQIKAHNIKKVCVSLSGGVDSIVLLYALNQSLGKSSYMRAIHINHNLVKNSGSWADFCKRTCDQLQIPIDIHSVKVNNKEGFGIEAAARKARYYKLQGSIQEGEWLMTAHHQDDQLETVLLRMARGTGVEGLQGIQKQFNFGRGNILRPFLGVSKSEILGYAKEKKLDWVVDTSNQETYFDRNFLRMKVIPTLKERWPAFSSSVSRLSDISTQTSTLLKELAEQDLGSNYPIKNLNIGIFKNKSIGRIINIIRFLILKNEMSVPSMKVLNSGVTKLLNPKSVNPSMVWDNYCIKRYLDKLYFLELSELQPNKCNKLMNWSIDQPLILDEDGSTLAATMTKGQGLSVKKCNKNLDVQFRKGGESMRPVGHKITKKLKKLFQEDHILPWTRDKIPLLYKKNELIGVGDLWFNQHYIASAEEDGFLVNWSRNISIKHN